MNKILAIILFSVIILSCTEDENPGQELINRTLIVYMAADNDLDADALTDMEEMKQGFSEKGANLIVFIDPLDEAPYLLEIGSGKENYIKSYPE